MKRIIIFDTTLRDGEQAAGASMTIDEKALIAQNLETLGVDVIEAGFAASSQSEFDAITRIAQNAKTATICSLSRAVNSDILKAFEAIKYAQKHRIHTFISTSEIHIKHKLKKTEAEVLEIIKSSVGYAKSLTQDIEWSAEDATRTDFDFLCRCVEMAINNGATTINIPDTVGYTLPNEYRALMEKLTQTFPGVVFSCHCHNDLGLAVANSLAAINGGAMQVECTVNGIGERAGNAALEELVMAFKVRRDIMNCDASIDSKHIARVSKLVSRITGFEIQKNKAIVGANAFSHASGIHQDGMIKNSSTYEIMNPQDVGYSGSAIVLGKLSGKAAVRSKLQELGADLVDAQLDEVFAQFKRLCDSKKNVYDEDLIALVSKNASQDIGDSISYSVSSDGGLFTTKISINTPESQVFGEASSHSGILDAGFNCINSILNIKPTLTKYEVKSLTQDIDSQAFVSITLNSDELEFTAKVYSCDVVSASFKAYYLACLKFLA